MHVGFFKVFFTNAQFKNKFPMGNLKRQFEKTYASKTNTKPALFILFLYIPTLPSSSSDQWCIL